MDCVHGAEAQQAPELLFCNVGLQNYSHNVSIKQHMFHNKATYVHACVHAGFSSMTLQALRLNCQEDQTTDKTLAF